MRARDDEHRRGADERSLAVALEPPEGEGDRARGEGDVEEHGGRAIGEGLGA